MAQTDPNRRYLISGTSLGLIDDTFPSALPPNGIDLRAVQQVRDHAGRTTTPTLPTLGVFLPLLDEPSHQRQAASRSSEFYADAAAGTLPSVLPRRARLRPSSRRRTPRTSSSATSSWAKVVNAVMSSPNWPKTLLIWTYDEHGGYYDHVPPPPAIPPDDIPPDAASRAILPAGSTATGSGSRPAWSAPTPRSDYVSHTVYDHTSILKTVETKWNLPALTRRDANATDVLDMIDLTSKPAFLTPPRLPDPANPAGSYRCLATGPGPIPPRSAVRPA